MGGLAERVNMNKIYFTNFPGANKNESKLDLHINGYVNYLGWSNFLIVYI